MNKLVRVTLGFGVLLIMMGIGIFFLSTPENQSAVAFVPIVIGVLLLAASWGITNPKFGQISSIAAFFLVLFLGLGSMRGFVTLINAFASENTPSIGIIAQVLIMILSVLYLVFVFMYIRKQVKSKQVESTP